MQIKLNLTYPHPPSSTKFILNNKPYSSLTIPYQPIFSLSQQIILSTDNQKATQSLLSILSNQTQSVQIKLLKDVIRLGKQIFNVDLQVDYEDFACNLVHQIGEKKKEITVEVLDCLSLAGIIRVIEIARGQVEEGSEGTLNALAEGYIKGSKRSEYQKIVLRKRIMTQTGEIVDNESDEQNQGQEQQECSQQESQEQQSQDLDDDIEESQQSISSLQQVPIKRQNSKQNNFKNDKYKNISNKQKIDDYYESQIQKLVDKQFAKVSTKQYNKNLTKKNQKYDWQKVKRSNNDYHEKGNKKYNNKNDAPIFNFDFDESPRQKYNPKQKYNKQDSYNNKYDKNKSKGNDRAPSYQYKQSYESQAKNAALDTQQMISFALFGSSTENWRQRNRPAHYKSQQYTRQHIAKILKPQPSIVSNRSKTPPKIYQLPPTFNSKKLFTYPHQGSTFKFSQQLLPFSIFIQPQNVTIEFYKEYLIVKLESKKTFKRSTKYAFLENGVVGEGVSILLNGLCLIEDGGEQIVKGDSQNLEIINQWFYIQQASICKLQ